MEALRLHEDTLENLSLDLRHHGAVRDHGIQFPPISLASFAHLEHVKINPVFLTGRLIDENDMGRHSTSGR